MQQQRDADAEDDLQGDRGHGVEHPVPERRPVTRLGKYPDVVGQPHEGRLVDKAFGVEKTQLDGVEDGDEQRSDAEQHAGRQKGEKQLAVAPFQGTDAGDFSRRRQRQRSHAAQCNHGLSSSW